MLQQQVSTQDTMQVAATPGYSVNFYGDISMLFWLVNGVIIGYIAGSLNNGSTNFKRMLGAGLTASIIVAVIQVIHELHHFA